MTTSHVPEADVVRVTRTPARRKKQQSMSIAGIALRTPYWVFTGALAVVFLFPLVWTSVSSLSPHPGTSQVHGWGFGNYRSLQHYQAGLERPGPAGQRDQVDGSHRKP